MLLYEEESFAVRGACYEVYNELGAGFLEALYHEALLLELSLRKIPFQSPKTLKLSYKGQPLAKEYEADVVCYDKIILELKAVAHIKASHQAQLQNYLKATRMPLGFIVNFGHHPGLEFKRIVR